MTPSRSSSSQTASRTASETADRIRDLIVSGAYEPGQRLPAERVLSKLLGVSRGTVREAIGQLAALNIVRSRQGAGTFVASLSADSLFAPLDFALRVDPDSLLHLYELRRILEPVAAGLAAVRTTRSMLNELQGLVREYDRILDSGRAIDPGSLARLIEIDEGVHSIVAAGSGNPLLTGILRSIGDAVHRARLITAVAPTTPPATRAELNALVDALTARDPLRSEAAMLRHVARLEETARQTVRAAARDDAVGAPKRSRRSGSSGRRGDARPSGR